MRKLNKVFVLACVLLANVVCAEPISLDFKSATVVDVVQTVVREIMKRDYVIAPDVIQADRRITVSVKKTDSDGLLTLLEGVLKTVDVQIENKGGILYIEKLKPLDTVSNAQSALPVQQTPSGEGQTPLTAQNVSKQENKVPEEIESYSPKGRTVDFLAAVVKAAGASVIDFKGKSEKLVFSGTKEAMEKARVILSQVDTSPISVHVRAVLVEFTDGKNESRSMNVALSILAGKIGAVYQAGNKLANALTYKGSTLNAAISAIEGDSRFKYVAEPSIRVVDGETAKLVVGSEVPTRGAVVTDQQGNAQQSIDYRTAGVVINLEPRVLDGMVSMKIGQQISSFALTTTSNIDSPTILKREAQTTIALKPGELVMLAGMDEERTNQSSSGLSFLPDFMHSKNHESSRSQLVLMLEVMPES